MKAEQNRKNLVRLCSMFAGILLWFVSIYFSVAGLQFATGNKWALPLGFAVGLVITFIELVFVEEGMEHGLVIIIMGVLAFAYGIITNVVGLLEFQGINDLNVVLDNPFSLVLPLIMGVFFELGPEPLFMWGWVGYGKDVFDAVMADRNRKPPVDIRRLDDFKKNG